LWTLFRRVKRQGFESEELLSVYREHGVIPKSSREDNFNKPSDDLSAYQLIEPGDLAVNKMKAWQGSVAISEHRGIVSPAYHVYTPLHSENSRFLHYLMRCDRYITGYLSISKGIRVNQWDLQPEYHSRMPVLLPPLDEQVAIASFLDRETAKIDALIAEQQRLIELLQEKRQAVISHAVTKGLNPTAPMKDSGVEWLGEVPEHWDACPLKHHWLVTDCKHITAEFTEDGHPLVSIREAQGRWVSLETAKRTTNDFYELLTEGGRKPQSGDLVFTRNATVGEVAEVPEGIEPFALGQDVVLLHQRGANTSSSYTWHLLRSTTVVNQLECAMVGSTFRRINVEQIKMLVIPVPPAEEQRSISSHLESTCGVWDLKEQDALTCISLLQERRSALISAAVTGQIDVRGLVPEASAV
jgi:type I restriction enzyme S subunit